MTSFSVGEVRFCVSINYLAGLNARKRIFGFRILVCDFKEYLCWFFDPMLLVGRGGYRPTYSKQKDLEIGVSHVLLCSSNLRHLTFLLPTVDGNQFVFTRTGPVRSSTNYSTATWNIVLWLDLIFFVLVLYLFL